MLSISAIISSDTVHIFRFYLDYALHYVKNMTHIIQLLNKSFLSLKCFKTVHPGVLINN